MKSIGLTDKLYWRYVGGWRCFKKLHGGGYISLCERVEISHSCGQSCNRPPVTMRCGMCDGREAERRGKDESMPASDGFRKIPT